VPAGSGFGGWTKRASGLALACTALLYPGPAGAAPGDLDPSHGRFGVKTLRSFDYVSSLTPGPGRTLLVAGRADDGNSLQIVRLDGGGNPDPTFGTNGVRRVAALGGVIDPLSGRMYSPDHSEPGQPFEELHALRPDGEPDTQFADNGIFTLGEQSFATVEPLLLENGKLLWACANKLVRLRADGSPDPSFGGGDGIVELAGEHSEVQALAEDQQGRYLATVEPDIGFQPIVVRTTPSGVLDTSFGSDGIADIPQIADLELTESLEVADDGTILVVGEVYGGIYGFNGSTMVWLDANGAPIETDEPVRTEGNVLLDPTAPAALDAQSITAPGAPLERVTGVLRRSFPNAGVDERFGDGGFNLLYPKGDQSYVGAMALSGRLVYVSGHAVASGEEILARFQLRGTASRDLDADGVRDVKDRCKFLPSIHRDGCGVSERRLKVERHRHRLTVLVRSKEDRGCMFNTRVRLTGRGVRRALITHHTNKLEFEDLDRGRYVLRVSSTYEGQRTRCSEARVAVRLP